MIPALSYVKLVELEQIGGRAHKASGNAKRLDSSLANAIRKILDSPRMSVALVLTCVVFTRVGFERYVRIPIGQNNTYAIHNYLTRSWLRSPIFAMEKGIVDRFGGVYPMTVYVSPKPGAGRILEDPAVLQAIDRLALFLRKQPGIGNVADVAYPIKLSNSFVHGEDDRYFIIPDTKAELGMEVLDLADRAPGAYLWL